MLWDKSFKRSLCSLALIMVGGGHRVSGAELITGTSPDLKRREGSVIQVPQELWSKNLLERRITISVMRVPVGEFIRKLRKEYGIHISFIEASDSKVQNLTVDLKGVSLATLLEKVVSQAPSYKFQVVDKRLVLYPKSPKYKLVVKGVAITNIERLEAAYRYTAQLNQQIPEFKELVGPQVLGNPRHFVFTDRVSLSKEGTVLEHLVQLLGQNESVVFSVIKAKSGVPMLTFEAVK